MKNRMQITPATCAICYSPIYILNNSAVVDDLRNTAYTSCTFRVVLMLNHETLPSCNICSAILMNSKNIQPAKVVYANIKINQNLVESTFPFSK